MNLVATILFSIAGGVIGAWILITVKDHTRN